jgi:hypothetical protein
VKIEVDEKVYIQKYDVACILNGITGFPGSLMYELFGWDENNVFFMNGMAADACKFDYSFEHPENVSWILKQDWILDYNEYAEIPLEDLKNMSCRLVDEHQLDIDAFNSRTLDYRSRNFRTMKSECEKYRNEITSLNLLIKEREGKISFKFPKDAKVKMPRRAKRRGFLAWLLGCGH